jgi:ankyrin repeat protein
MRAAYMGHLEVCRQLIDNKPMAADVSLRDADGESALDKATKQGCQEVVEFLSKHM